MLAAESALQIKGLRMEQAVSQPTRWLDGKEFMTCLLLHLRVQSTHLCVTSMQTFSDRELPETRRLSSALLCFES